MSFNKDALLHKLQDEADKWEEIPDEDLWQDGELNSNQVMDLMYIKVIQEGNWKLMRRKDND
tara:strand:+ start:1151 stop:1336 length:186 start_codon:yes stop_codon:yes gene_type:complete